jgi:hypothetical protein
MVYTIKKLEFKKLGILPLRKRRVINLKTIHRGNKSVGVLSSISFTKF